MGDDDPNNIITLINEATESKYPELFIKKNDPPTNTGVYINWSTTNVNHHNHAIFSFSVHPTKTTDENNTNMHIHFKYKKYKPYVYIKLNDTNYPFKKLVSYEILERHLRPPQPLIGESEIAIIEAIRKKLQRFVDWWMEKIRV